MKRITALILALLLVFSLAACGGNEEGTTTTTEAYEDELTQSSIDEVQAEATEPSSSNATGETVAASDSTDPSATNAETTVAESTVPAISEAPSEKAEILALYNKTVNDAYASKVGFSKERYTDNEVLNTSGALKAFKSLVYKFMGIGADNKYTKTVTKGQWDGDVPHHYLRKSTLTEADVTSANCTESNGKYTIVLQVKNGSSKATETEKANNSPIDKCGICVGDADKDYFDHKTAPVIYSAISEVYPSAVINESYSKAVVKAVIDGATGNLVSLTVEYDIACTIDVGIIGEGDATGSTHITYKNFKY